MNTNPSPASAEERMQALEARIARLEQQCADAQLDIPWHVICAAVAAVMPDVRIVRVTHAQSSSPDRWRNSALQRNIHSHQIR
jgi:hypothetical protein